LKEEYDDDMTYLWIHADRAVSPSCQRQSVSS